MEICKREECCGCGVCVEVCPQKCITMKLDEEGFYYPSVATEKCIHCKLCQTVCPGNSEMKTTDNTEAYAILNVSKGIRENSSSGGAFYSLASKVLEAEGIVFGVAFTEGCEEVKHICIEKIDELEKIMGSKYVQTTPIDNLYQSIRKALRNDKIVLFSGTPCQVGACKRFLENEKTTKLITVDLICHGVPAPGVWKKYLKETASNIKNVFFRDKTEGWRTFSLKIDTNDRTILQRESQNAYMKGFLNDLYSRICCYNCKFKGLNRESDITLGDFWKVGNMLPRLDDDMGTSIVFTHSEKGDALLQSVIEDPDIKFCKVEASAVVDGNPMIFESIKLSKKRNIFFTNWKELSIENNVMLCLRKNIYEKIVGKIKWGILRK